MLSTGIAIVLICFGAFLDLNSCSSVREFPKFSLSNYLYELGTMLFTYGGHSAFPTIQHDMKKPSHFDRSAIFGFILMSIFNFAVVSITGFIYGNSMGDSVINSIQTVWVQQAVNLMITAHCLLTVTLIINPLNQEVEELFDVPHDFCWKRIIVRTGVFASIVFVAESVPSFEPVLNFFGGSTVALTSVIFPCLFYLYLSAGEKKANESAHFGCDKPPTFSEMIARTDRSVLFICGFVIVLSSLAGIIATISALISLMGTSFTPPCYLNHLFQNKDLINQHFDNQTNLNNSTHFSSILSATNCCGPFKNISRYGPISENFCIASDLQL
jgi:vesicular inhibitory amino acid transporter